MIPPLASQADRLPALGHDLDRHIEDPSDAALARQRARLVRAIPVSSRRPWRALAAPIALAAAGAVAVVHARATPSTITAQTAGAPLRTGQWVAADGVPVMLDFSDGTHVTLSPGAHARLEHLDARGASLLLERGHASARVHHTARSSWRFAAGPYAVDVTGTAFELAWEPGAGRFDLSMREGRVVLRGPRCAEGIAVRDRDEVHADTAARTLTLGPLVAPSERVTPTIATPTPQVPIPSTPRLAERPSRSRREAIQTSPDRAAHASPDEPVADEVSALLQRADELRVASHGMRAREILLDVRRRFASTPGAARAAFVLGVLSLETFHAPAESSRWFELYLREAPDGPLAREALGRSVQSLHDAGDDAGARVAAERYLARDPDGPFSTFARGILGR